MNKINIGIVGYGNLGKGAESVLKYTEDMELVAIFTRRSPDDIKPSSVNIDVVHIDNIYNYINKIDVLILCGGSATDLPIQGPELSKYFNIVDSFDTHAKIPEYKNAILSNNCNSGKLSIISIGWDPGIFSIIRGLSEAIITNGNTYTFWGKGVSQGHSDAIRRIDGVKDAVEYTIPVDSAIESVRKYENPNLTIKDKHVRECFVVLNDDANIEDIDFKIKNMPNYFADYNTIVHFISEEEFNKNHKALTHGGRVLRTGYTGNINNKNNHLLEFSLLLDSNPEFTASVLVAYARAAYKLNQEGIVGVKTIFDIPISYLFNIKEDEIIKKLL